MNTHEKLISDFYTCFQNKDYKGMQSCYHSSAVFSDEVFVNLNAAEVKAMWEMLVTAGKDLQLEFRNVFADENKGHAEWIAYYTFSRSGNKVINRIKADFIFKEGKIVKHIDHFNFYTWAKQALGLSGILLGWTPFMKNKIRKAAMKNLKAFMGKKNHLRSPE